MKKKPYVRNIFSTPSDLDDFELEYDLNSLGVVSGSFVVDGAPYQVEVRVQRKGDSKYDYTIKIVPTGWYAAQESAIADAEIALAALLRGLE